MSKRRVLNEMLGGERRDLTEGFDLARQAAALKKKHTDGLQKDLSTLAKEGAKQLTSAGHSVSVARAELTHKGSPSFWFEVSVAADHDRILDDIRKVLGPHAKLMRGRKPGEYTIVVGS